MNRRDAALLLGLALFAAYPAAAAADDDAEFAFDPHPGAQLPFAATLTDENGAPMRLGSFFGSGPVVLVLDYLRCKTLCGLTLQNLVAALDALPLDAGSDFQFVAISIDPRDRPADAAAAKSRYLANYRHAGGGDRMHFLTGPEAAVRDIAAAIGYRYRYDAATGQYVHPAGAVLVTPAGRISRYVYGVDPPAAELRSGLADAAAGRNAGPLTRLLLLCRSAGEPLGRLTVPVLAAFTLANLLATAALVAVFTAIRRRRHG